MTATAPTFACNYARLREVAGELIGVMPAETDLDALEAGLKCFNLHYLACTFNHDHEEAGAIALMQIVNREYMQAEQRILSGR
jgi:hypothetical protein